MRVIVNVDDLGLHPAVRRAVEELFRAGAVTSATLLVNGPDAEAAARLADNGHGPGLGVHLNLLRGRPALPPAEIPSLVGEDGLFLGDYAALFKRYVTGRLDHAEVEREWAAQVERALDLGVRPTHFDSEKHVHAWPTLMSVAADLARRFGVGWLRRPMDCQRLARVDAGGLRAKFLGVCSLFQTRPSSVRWPDLAFGIADQGANLTPARFKAYLSRNPGARVVEVVCHPGRPLPGDPEIPAEYGRMRVPAQWAVEYEALSDPEWGALYRSLGAELVHYGQMP
jgi:predicted glycoside hydrolase/deacetylase ChbG (UPF0249 family)